MASKGYDTLYQAWLVAHKAQDYATADAIREDFEREHRLTIIAEGDMPIESITTRRMRPHEWEKKYGNVQVADIMATTYSKWRQ
jgi:hypothetical protein